MLFNYFYLPFYHLILNVVELGYFTNLIKVNKFNFIQIQYFYFKYGRAKCEVLQKPLSFWNKHFIKVIVNLQI